jgi:large subunit ribosomal protein L17
MENRLGDNAEMALIELVDYNTVYTKDGAAATAKKSTRRRGGKAKTAEAAAPAVEAAPVTEAVEVADEPVVNSGCRSCTSS